MTCKGFYEERILDGKLEVTVFAHDDEDWSYCIRPPYRSLMSRWTEDMPRGGFV